MYDQLANPFRKDSAPVRRPPPGVNPREWARLYVMALVLLMVIGTMIYVRKVTSPKPKTDKPGQEQVDYAIKGTPRKAAPDAAGEGPPPEGQQKKDIPIPPLPKDGEVSFRELAAPFHDGQENLVKESPEFINLLNVFLNSVSSESLSKRVNPDVTGEAAYLEPAKHRGEVLRCYGRLIYIYPDRIDATTPNNVEVVYLGIMQEYPTNRTVYFYLPELPRDPATGKLIAFGKYRKSGQEFYDDWAEVEGVFLRRYIYPSQYDDEKGRTVLAKASVLFVKNLRLRSKPQYADPRGSFIIVVGGLAVVVVAIVLVAGIMTRKYGSGSLRMKIFQLKRTQGKGEFPPSKPSEGKQILGDEVSKLAPSRVEGPVPLAPSEGPSAAGKEAPPGPA